MSLLPSQEGVHSSLDAAVSYTRATAASNGYALTIRCSKKNKKRKVYKIWLMCDCGRVYDPHELTNEVRR